MKLTKQMLHEMIAEELEEGLRRNPTLSPERLHQLRVKLAKQDPAGAGYIQYWTSLGNDTRTDGVVLNVEDMEGILTPEEYKAYAAGWERGKASNKNFFTPLEDPPTPPGTSRQDVGQKTRFSGWDAKKQHLYNRPRKK